MPFRRLAVRTVFTVGHAPNVLEGSIASPDRGVFIPILQSMNLTEYVLQRLVVQVVQGNPNEVHKALTVWSVSCAMSSAHRFFHDCHRSCYSDGWLFRSAYCGTFAECAGSSVSP